ncbi:hypothetical protein DVS77_26240 [Mycolicibacterium moriokaense]|nr:hypothetical protein DVS77_26240 [Mycolicibacterium moriokaense]
MTDNTKWAVTVHRKNGEDPTTVLHYADSAQAAIKSAADNLGVEVDDAGNVTGDDEIARLTAAPDPDAQERMKL